jgi:glycosyltransferase involved in cell wall biosynthesis
LIDFALGRLNDAEAAALARRAELDSEFAHTLDALRQELATLDGVRPAPLASLARRSPSLLSAPLSSDVEKQSPLTSDAAEENAPPSSADADERAAAKIALLKELKLPYEPGRLPFLIGLVARLWPQKRVKEALWAADQLKFAQLDFYLLVIGDGPERESLLRYRDALRATDRVRFLGERDDVSRLMPSFDVLWNCSAYEGQSNAILEAQSLGVPVIASDVPGNRDLVIPGETGVLVPEFDGDRIRRRTALTRETFRLLKDENASTRRALAEAARARVEREFSIDALIARHAELYERLGAEKKRR